MALSDSSWQSSHSHKSHHTCCSSAHGTPHFKVILTGEVGVGKTAFFSRVRLQDEVLAEASTSSASTILVDTCSRTFSTRFGHVTLTLWDTAGVERYRTLTRNYYRNTHAALLVFGLDDPATLFYLPRWQRDVAESAPSAALYLVGNKSDLERQVAESAMQSFASSHNCQAAFLTSALTGEGVQTALTAVCEDLVSRYHRQSDLYDHQQLWMQGSGLHVHGSGEHDDASNKRCC
ncbi:ras-related protein Rab-43-like [Babylonia areolata]|uniref:ras-related protein Rab-43-like n=1 Tax=Babylonia areolata TaxID=304850 RepID=UPI003FD00E0E